MHGKVLLAEAYPCAAGAWCTPRMTDFRFPASTSTSDAMIQRMYRFVPHRPSTGRIQLRLWLLEDLDSLAFFPRTTCRCFLVVTLLLSLLPLQMAPHDSAVTWQE